MNDEGIARRPIPARGSHWAKATAARLARLGLQPNQVSVLSVAISCCAGVCLVLGARSSLGPRIILLLAAALLIEARLLCNLFDGMLAIEGGLQTKTGPIFNELPDRLSDAVILVCAGYAVTVVPWGIELGWAAALLAVLTAYVRALAGVVGATQDFGGPMAKQQRMQTLALACVAAAVLSRAVRFDAIILAALVLIAAGSAATVVRRALKALKELESR